MHYTTGMNNSGRYSRQILVDKFGLEGQRKLTAAKVLVIGAGGLGCTVAAQLSGAGVGSLDIVDHDLVSLSNLHRQILFREHDIGNSKAQVAAHQLASINSDISIHAHSTRLSTDNITDLMQDMDLVVDAADNFATSYLLSDVCLQQGLPLISASVNRTFGYLGVFCGTQSNPAPSLRAVFPKLPIEQQSCDLVGVTGPSVGIIASLQAQESLKVLLGDKDQLLAKLLYCDLWNYRQHIVDFSKAKEPEEEQIALIGRKQISIGDYVVDVRNADEVATQPQAFKVDLNCPLSELEPSSLSEHANQRLVLACKSGQRALIAAQQLQSSFSSIAVILPDSSD